MDNYNSNLFFIAYLVMFFPSGKSQIFDRNYNLISDNNQLAIDVLGNLEVISTWLSYPAPITQEAGNGFWVKQR